MPAISADEQDILKRKSVLVVGCGGLGGYAIEYLARLGIGHITAVDGDVFCESNLNRQLLSSSANIGKSKSSEAATRIAAINPEIDVKAVSDFLTANNAAELLNGVDIVIDALDNVEARLVLEDACEAARITIVHGAVQGWNLQATVVLTGSKTLHKLYKADTNTPAAGEVSRTPVTHEASKEDPLAKSCLCPTPACCAAIQVSEALKILLGRKSSLDGNMLFMDLQTMESYTIPLL